MRYIMSFIAVLLSGCETLAESYLPDKIMTQSEANFINQDGIIDLSSLKKTHYTDRIARNEVIAKAISLSDQKCTLHKAGIMSNSHAWNVGTGSASILFAGTASVISHTQTASELAAAAAAITGIQSLVNKEVYSDALGTTILRSIDIGREKRKAVLEQGMTKPSTDYSMATALIDIQAYHDSCSLMAGLVEVTKAFDNRRPSKIELDRDIDILKSQLADANTELAGVSPTSLQTIKDEYAEAIKDKVLERISASD
ncbi:hypothetical protein [Vibrio campbellii]|uniref:hypothetical protein n=1 Tax=Vibrio campbellii TaxID=680 RepID=UPI0005EFEB4D|nr:hypothetical protein [Vibrio campbellii]